MADIIAHDNAVFVDAEDKTLDKVLKQTKEDIIATAEAVASEDNLANVKIGDNINVTEDGIISVLPATDTRLGVIKTTATSSAIPLHYGNLVVLNIGPDSGKVFIPMASELNMGVIKKGDTLYISSDGILDVASNALTFSPSDFQNSPPGIDTFSSGWDTAVFKALNASASSLHEYTQLQIEINRFLKPVCTGFLNVEESDVLYRYAYNVYNDPKDLKIYVLYKKVDISS